MPDLQIRHLSIYGGVPKGASATRANWLPKEHALVLPPEMRVYAEAAEATPARRRAPLGSISGLIEVALASDRYLARCFGTERDGWLERRA